MASRGITCFRYWFFIPLLSLPALGANAKVTELRFRCQPKECKVRPFESLVVQVQAWGEAIGASGETKKGRLRRAASKVQMQEADGGWLSKPFRFQGDDEGGFVETAGTTFMSIFETASTRFVVKDSVLYTAPEKAGRYTIAAELDGQKATLTVEVDAGAATTRKPETVAFPAETRLSDPYRALAEHYAPMLAQETWYTPKADIPTRFDFDGDLLGDNNWDNLEKGTSKRMSTMPRWKPRRTGS